MKWVRFTGERCINEINDLTKQNHPGLTQQRIMESDILIFTLSLYIANIWLQNPQRLKSSSKVSCPRASLINLICKRLNLTFTCFSLIILPHSNMAQVIKQLFPTGWRRGSKKRSSNASLYHFTSSRLYLILPCVSSIKQHNFALVCVLHSALTRPESRILLKMNKKPKAKPTASWSLCSL